MSKSGDTLAAPMDDYVSFFAVDDSHLRSYQEAREALLRFRVPSLVDAASPNEKLYIAAFDGTGNNADKDPLHGTNIARMRDQIGRLGLNSEQVHLHYLPGPGTQSNPVTRVVDGALGYTYQQRLEAMYEDLTRNATHWFRDNPDVQIRVLSTGFSRGASQAAGFTNLLHERGIVDLDSETIGPDGKIVFDRHISAPGLTPQAVGLFDPVATGVPEQFDRRLAPSVVSGFQITALDEVRAKFPSDQIIAPGVSEDGRFLNVQVAGAHSDIGGSYIRDGLARRSCNLMVDYCNALRPGAPLLEKVYEPTDPRLNVVHRSEEGLLLYQVDRKVDRSTAAGVNVRLAPEHMVAADGLPHAAKPFGPELERGKPGDVLSAVANLNAEESLATLRGIETAQQARVVAAEQATRARMLGTSAAVLTTGVEVASAAHDYTRLRNEGNLTAAQATLTRSASNVTGAWMGFEAGMVVGSPLGPGALAVGAIGAVAGGVAGDKLADAIEHERIYTQKGSDGNRWTADPIHPELGWRLALPPLPPTVPHVAPTTASPALADELNFKAVTKATELGMAVASAQNPLKLAANKADTFSAWGGDWSRNPHSGHWQREINNDKPGMGHTVIAAPKRATELDVQASQITADNAARSPAALAATYKAMYLQNHWQRHGDGKLPEAIEKALSHPDRVLASDGRKYDRQPDGQWKHEGWVWDSRADGNLLVELDLAFEAQRTMVQKLLESGAQVPDTTTLETVKVRPSPEQHAEMVAPNAPSPKSVEAQAIPQPGRLSGAYHPAHAEFQHVLRELHRAEKALGVPHGKHSEQVAAALTVESELKGVSIDTVRIAQNGQIEGLPKQSALSESSIVRVDSNRALSMSVDDHLNRWAQSQSITSERTAEQQRSIASLSPGDQAMFTRIRHDVPGHVGDEQVMRALLDAKQANMADANKIDKVMMAGDQICIAGTVPGFRSMTDSRQAAPPLQETIGQVQANNQQREQQVAMEQQRPDGPAGRSMA
jgi:outer membrane lipoprotein SlyB